MANDLQVSLILCFYFSSLFSDIVLSLFNLSSLLGLFLECHSHRGLRPAVPVHLDFNYIDADWPSYGFDDLCSDLALMNGLLCFILFLCWSFCIRTGNDSCSDKQGELEHKQGPPRRHLRFSQNTSLYMCMFVMLINLTF